MLRYHFREISSESAQAHRACATSNDCGAIGVGVVVAGQFGQTLVTREIPKLNVPFVPTVAFEFIQALMLKLNFTCVTASLILLGTTY
jgi:hypothetical protein